MIVNYHTQEKGFVILFAVLISAVILLIGAGVFSISVKESILSSSAREAQYAINAADAGMDCVLYDDLQPLGQINQTGQVSCVGYANGNTFQPITNVMKFEFDDPQSGQQTCAHVTRDDQEPFTSDEIALGYTSALYSKITVYSRGFNLCNDVDPVTVDPLLVERVIRARYIKPNSQNP